MYKSFIKPAGGHMSRFQLMIFNYVLFSVISLFLVSCTSETKKEWKPNTDWGHWILGHRSNLEFLEKNNMTVTFGSGAPDFGRATRAQFDSSMNEAKIFNQSYHDKGYIVLRYLSTSLGGRSESNQDTPKKDQIRLLDFYNNNWQDFEDYIGPKPEQDPTTWIMVRPDGTFPFYRYAPYGRQPGAGFEAWGVPVNPDYVRFMEGKVRAQAETGIDGSYVDWTHIAGGTSYDTYSKQSFIEYLNNNLPPEVGKAKYGTDQYDQIELPEKFGDKFWMEWITYRGHSVAEFHKHLRTVARKYNPNFMISGNVYGGFGYGPIAYDAAGNMEMLGREGYDDFIYSEMQEYLDLAPRKNEEGIKVTNSPAIKFLAAVTHGKPVIVYATEITPPIFPDPTEKCLSAMSQINIAEAVANHAIFREKRETPPGATEIYGFLAANRPHFIGAHLYSNVAILASLNQYLANEQSFAFSSSRVLADRGIGHAMIVEDDLLNGNLEEYDLIYVPYLPLLSEAKQEALKSYVESGGNLLILGESGIKDQFNLPQNSVLAGMLGGTSYPSDKMVKNIGEGKVEFIPLVIPDSKFLIPFKQGKDVTTFGPTMGDVFADIPEGYSRGRINPHLREVLEEVAVEIESLLPGKISRLVDASPYLEMTTMRQKNNNLILVHLVNYDVVLDGTITPTENVIVQLRVPDGMTAKNVRYSGTLSEMQPVSFDNTGQTIQFVLPQVGIYALAVVEL
jgi:hypothetical protein